MPALLLVLLSAAPALESQETLTARAAQHFREAREAYARGESAEAARLFEQAAREAPHAASLFNAALAWEEAGERARAADDYDLALDLGQLSAAQERDARLRLAALTKLLGTLILAEPRGATVQVAHLENAPLPLTVHLAPGDHRVVITAVGGERTERTVSLRAGEVQTLAIEPPLLELPPEVPLRPPPVAAVATPLAPLPTQKILAWVSLSTGAALSATAVGLGVGALNSKTAYEQSGFTSVSEYNRASAFRTWTNVSWGAAALFGGAGLALMFIPPPAQHAPVRVSYGLGSVSLDGTF